jgi:hypothetical protein
MKSSNLSFVVHPVTEREVMVVKHSGTFLMCMSCMSCSLTMLRKAPWTSRESATATLSCLQVFLILCTTSSMASIVLWPGHPPN